MYSSSTLYKTWNYRSGVAVRKRNWRWWAGQTAKSWRKPRLFLTTRDTAINRTYDSSLQSFIDCVEVVEEKSRNVVVVVVTVVVVVEENNRNVVVVVDNYRILWPSNLYKCATFHHFLSLHSAPEELTWLGSVPFAKIRLVERIGCKVTWCLYTAMLVSPHFKQFQCLHRSRVSGLIIIIIIMVY